MKLLSLFSGAGGLDLGFESAGFEHVLALDSDPSSCATLRKNRPTWEVVQQDARLFNPKESPSVDCLIAGFPCQGFSLGGKRDPEDDRNSLYLEVVRTAQVLRPSVVVIENVLNLRTMKDPLSNKPFAETIADALRKIGYEVRYEVFRVSHYGVPQTRRRFVFIAALNGFPKDFFFPQPDKEESTARQWLWDLAHDENITLPNHEVLWGFPSSVHTSTGKRVSKRDSILPVRFSRTASDGNPVRDWDAPFPTVDTGTMWGFAQGNVQAARFEKDRTNGAFVRNPDATVRLWRIEASRLRALTHRELARLQTFPDDWVFEGDVSRDVHRQIGNAVPVAFAARIGRTVAALIEAKQKGLSYSSPDGAHPSTLF